MDSQNLQPRESTDDTDPTGNSRNDENKEMLYSVPRRPTVRRQQQPEPTMTQQDAEPGSLQRRQSRPRLPTPTDDQFIVLRPLVKPTESHYSVIGDPHRSSPLRGKEYAYPQDEINRPLSDSVPSSPLITPRLANMAAEINRIRLTIIDSEAARPRLNTNGSEYAFPQSSVGGSRSGSFASSTIRKYNSTPKSPLKSPTFNPSDPTHYALASRTDQTAAYENAKRKVSSDSEKYAVPVKRSEPISSAPRPDLAFGYAAPQDTVASSAAEGDIENEAVIVRPRV